MNITCLCMYHGRNHCLPEALESYRRQEPVEGVSTELLVLADIPEQYLEVDMPGVKVANVSPQYEEMALKQNDGVAMADGEWVLLWDDDDISLPWRVRVMVEAQRKTGAPALCTSRAWYSEKDHLLNISANMFAGSALFRRDFYLDAGGSPCGMFSDRGAWFAMEEAGECVCVAHEPAEIPYIYRWEQGMPHDSGIQFRNAKIRHNRFHNEAINDPRFIHGKVKIKPEWRRDYVQDVQDAIRDGRDVL